jgi:hypothetical protein
MQQYVLARITTMTGIDVALFDRDWHNSIYFFVVNADEQIYLRYGGRDSEDAGTYHNLDSLTLALQAGLKQHELYKAGKLPPQPRPAPLYPQEIVSVKREVIDRNRCVECHLIGDYKAQDDELASKLDKRRTMYASPDLKTIGIHLDVPKGLVVAQAEGAAAQAGMQRGDLITAFNQTPVLTFGDLQYRWGKLERSARQIKLTVERAGQAKTLTIKLPDEWWYTDTTFRYWTIEPMVYFTAQPLSAAQKRQLKCKADGFASEITEVDPIGTSLKLHTLQKGDIVYAVNGVETSKLTRNVERYLKLTTRAGDSVQVKLLRNGQPLELTVKTHRQYFRKQRTEKQQFSIGKRRETFFLFPSSLFLLAQEVSRRNTRSRA